MKYLLFLLLMPVLLSGQCNIVYGEAGNVCLGDSFVVGFKYSGPLGVNYAVKLTPDNGAPMTVKTINSDDFSSYPTHASDPTVYLVTVPVPNNLPLTQVATTIGSGGGMAYYIWTIQCTPTGIHDYLHPIAEPIYFDLQGHQVQPVPNQLLIEQRGTYRRKIFIR